MLEEFNQRRRQRVFAHFFKVADETMSAFLLQMMKNGNLPYLSWIQRKLEDLGTELKTMCCSVTRNMLHKEMQRSKEGTFGRKYENLAKRVKPLDAREWLMTDGRDLR